MFMRPVSTAAMISSIRIRFCADGCSPDAWERCSRGDWCSPDYLSLGQQSFTRGLGMPGSTPPSAKAVTEDLDILAPAVGTALTTGTFAMAAFIMLGSEVGAKFGVRRSDPAADESPWLATQRRQRRLARTSSARRPGSGPEPLTPYRCRSRRAGSRTHRLLGIGRKQLLSHLMQFPGSSLPTGWLAS